MKTNRFLAIIYVVLAVMFAPTVLASDSQIFCGVSDSVDSQPVLGIEACAACHSDQQRTTTTKTTDNITGYPNNDGHGDGGSESVKMNSAMFKRSSSYIEVGWRS